MAIRAKTKKRIFILCGIMFLGIFLMGSTYVALKLNRKRVRKDFWQRAVQAAKEGRYSDSMKLFADGNVLNDIDYRNDPETMYLRAKALRALPTSGGRHIDEAIRHLDHVLKFDPNHKEAADEIFELYIQRGLYTEAAERADQILVLRPDDQDAWQARVRAKFFLGQIDEAATQVDEALKRHPKDWRMHVLRVEIMKRSSSCSIFPKICAH